MGGMGMDELTDRELALAEIVEGHEAAMRGYLFLLEDVHEPGCDPNDPHRMCRLCIASLGLYWRLKETQT